jgi:hypothetical protein
MGEPALEERTGHHAVLHGEETEQSRVDRESGPERRRRGRVNGFGHERVSNKASGVADGRKESSVGNCAVEQDGGAMDKERSFMVIIWLEVAVQFGRACVA